MSREDPDGNEHPWIWAEIRSLAARLTSLEAAEARREGVERLLGSKAAVAGIVAGLVGLVAGIGFAAVVLVRWVLG